MYVNLQCWFFMDDQVNSEHEISDDVIICDKFQERTDKSQTPHELIV